MRLNVFGSEEVKLSDDSDAEGGHSEMRSCFFYTQVYGSEDNTTAIEPATDDNGDETHLQIFFIRYHLRGLRRRRCRRGTRLPSIAHHITICEYSQVNFHILPLSRQSGCLKLLITVAE